MRVTIPREDSTARLDMYRPAETDLPDLFGIFSDPRVWTHFPTLRHTVPDQTAATIERWMRDWQADGLGVWVARDSSSRRVIGYGGCSSMGGLAWNLGYRLAPEAQGRGLATELARRAMVRAGEAVPERPIIAYLLEHNRASAAVAGKLGMTLAHRAPDAGNPDPAAIRLVYSDRPLTADHLTAALR